MTLFSRGLIGLKSYFHSLARLKNGIAQSFRPSSPWPYLSSFLLANLPCNSVYHLILMACDYNKSQFTLRPINFYLPNPGFAK